MLSPDARSLYTGALTPPPGFAFDEALGTTFSLDPAVLLSVPVHLALLGGHRPDAMRDGIAVLEAVRRLAGRITIYAQRGRLLVPSPPNPLYGLLEPTVIEVVAPRGGVCHAKLWALRFVEPGEGGKALLRLMVLSRNLTNDRSWDVALTLEGTPTSTYQDRNRGLGELLASLPSLAVGEVAPGRVEQAERLGDELRRTLWELPQGFEDLSFHVLGRTSGSWRPPGAARLAVVSPFCTDEALVHLSRCAPNVDVLVSRPETLLALREETVARFGRRLALDEAAETEDGEDVSATGRDTLGLHAKVYVFERSWNTHVVVGSANATSAALLRGLNLEVLAELVGKRSRVGGIDQLFGPEGLGDLLAELPTPSEGVEADPAAQAAEAALKAAREGLARTPLRAACTAAQDGTYTLVLNGLGPCPSGLAEAKAWPITVAPSHSVELWPADERRTVAFAGLAAASLTGFVAFELGAAACDTSIRFVLNVPVDGLPEARDTAILQTVVRNREGFLRYLLFLLGDLGSAPEDGDDGQGEGWWGAWSGAGLGGPALLEELVRAYSRAPDRLRHVGRVIERLTARPSEEEIVPAELLEVWRVFERALERRDG